MSRTLRALLAVGLPLLGAGCSSAGDNLGVQLPNGRGLSVLVVYDRDLSGGPTNTDSVLAGVTIYLKVPGGADTIMSGLTNGNGVATFTGLPAGPYSVELPASILGDSLTGVAVPNAVYVTPGGPAPTISVAAAFVPITIQQARAAAVGKRVLVTGVILSGPASSPDTSAYMHDSSGAVRLQAVRVLVGGNALPGDSVRVLGTVAVRNGQHVLDSARVSLLQPVNLPEPDTLTTAAGATAAGGTLDAALVFFGNTEILDTLTQGPALVVTLDDGTGPVEMVLDSLLTVNPALFVPGDSVSATGVLVPNTTGSWQLVPRTRQDITVF